jgi:hypothetical protein
LECFNRFFSAFIDRRQLSRFRAYATLKTKSGAKQSLMALCTANGVPALYIWVIVQRQDGTVHNHRVLIVDHKNMNYLF